MAPASDYLPASAISQNGFAKDAAAQHTADGKEIKLWGFVDHANLYGDADTQEILGEWWSGDGPSATSWRFNLMAHADDQAGQSFAVHVPNDEGRDELLRNFLADAKAQRPTKVFVTGRLFTFDAPSQSRQSHRPDDGTGFFTSHLAGRETLKLTGNFLL